MYRYDLLSLLQMAVLVLQIIGMILLIYYLVHEKQMQRMRRSNLDDSYAILNSLREHQQRDEVIEEFLKRARQQGQERAND